LPRVLLLVSEDEAKKINPRAAASGFSQSGAAAAV
jgi:hypothetical protein